MRDLDTWFNPIYSDNYSRLVKTAYYILWDEDLVEDIVQNAFSALLIKQEQLRDHPNISGWLTLTVRNMADNERNRARYTREIPLLPQHEPTADESPPDFCRCFRLSSAAVSGRYYTFTLKRGCPMRKSPPSWAASRRPAV